MTENKYRVHDELKGRANSGSEEYHLLYCLLKVNRNFGGTYRPRLEKYVPPKTSVDFRRKAQYYIPRAAIISFYSAKTIAPSTFQNKKLMHVNN
jgi:hypothetical protein